MEQVIHPEIKGWGVDADPRFRPAYPKKKNPPEGTGAHWDKPTQQHSDIKVLHSNERPGLTSVYGTSVPLKGLSGLIRRFAFRYGEASFAHWMPLLLADRINVVEGLVDDLTKGRMPNVFAEMGVKSEWKHNKKGLITRISTVMLFICVPLYFFLRKK